MSAVLRQGFGQPGHEIGGGEQVLGMALEPGQPVVRSVAGDAHDDADVLPGRVRGDGPGREVCAAYEAAVAAEVAHARSAARPELRAVA